MLAERLELSMPCRQPESESGACTNFAIRANALRNVGASLRAVNLDVPEAATSRIVRDGLEPPMPLGHGFTVRCNTNSAHLTGRIWEGSNLRPSD